jgi:hypothetical protein
LDAAWDPGWLSPRNRAFKESWASRGYTPLVHPALLTAKQAKLNSRAALAERLIKVLFADPANSYSPGYGEGT